jgi:hypothetical protein
MVIMKQIKSIIKFPCAAETKEASVPEAKNLLYCLDVFVAPKSGV